MGKAHLAAVLDEQPGLESGPQGFGVRERVRRSRTANGGLFQSGQADLAGRAEASFDDVAQRLGKVVLRCVPGELERVERVAL